LKTLRDLLVELEPRLGGKERVPPIESSVSYGGAKKSLVISIIIKTKAKATLAFISRGGS